MYFIVGSHRSGTSPVSRITGLLGTDLGPEDDLIGPSSSQPYGHWENRSLVQVNDELLRRADGSWDRPPLLADGWERDPTLDPLREYAASLVGRLFTDAPSGFKDPRCSLLLPFWRTVTEVEGCVLVLRDPRAVAASLQERYGLAPEAGAWLSLIYTVSAWRHADRCSVVRYEDLVSHPADVAIDLSAFLHLPEPEPDTLARVDSSLKPSRRPAGLTDEPGRWMRLALAMHHVLTTSPGAADPLVDGLYEGWLAERERIEASQSLERYGGVAKRIQGQLEHLEDRLKQRLRAVDRELALRNEQLAEARHRESSWAGVARQIERSRTWRLGNFLVRALRLLTFRRPVASEGPGELAAKIESADSDRELTGPQGGDDSAP